MIDCFAGGRIQRDQTRPVSLPADHYGVGIDVSPFEEQGFGAAKPGISAKQD